MLTKLIKTYVSTLLVDQETLIMTILKKINMCNFPVNIKLKTHATIKMIKDPGMAWDFTVVDKNDKSISTLPVGQENLFMEILKKIKMNLFPVNIRLKTDANTKMIKATGLGFHLC